MSNAVFQQLEGNKFDMNTEYNNFVQNPLGYLANKKVNIPSEYQNNPHDAVQYLLNNGNMNQAAFNKVYGILQKMGFKF